MTMVGRRKSGLDLLAKGSGAGGKRHDGLRQILLGPTRLWLGRRNRLSNFTFFLLAAAGGSAASVLAILLASWALISAAIGRFRWRFERSDRPVLFSTLLFFAVVAGSNAYHGLVEGGMSALEAGRGIGRLLPLVFPLFLIPRMRCSTFADSLPPAFRGAAVGGVLLIPIAIASFILEQGRAEGFAGNAGPFSVTALLASGWALLSIERRSGGRWLLVAVLGAFGGAAAVVLSGMRGAWPALPLVLAIGVFARRKEIAACWREELGRTRRIAVLGIAALVLLAAGYLALPAIGGRLDAMMSDLSLIAADVDSATSLNLRRSMYGAAVEAIAVRPLFGYGAAAHWSAIEPYLHSHAFQGFSFSHLHNIFLTVGIDAGLVGILALVLMMLAPLWTSWRARRGEGGTRRMAAALILIVAFLVPGLSNIMLFHDILDAVWIFSLSLIAASVPPPVRG